MEHDSPPVGIWERVQERLGSSSTNGRYLEELKEQFPVDDDADIIATVGERTIEVLVNYLVAVVDSRVKHQQYYVAHRRASIAHDNLDVAVFENEGIELGARAHVDPHLLVIRRGDVTRDGDGLDPREAATYKLASFVRRAVDSVATALQMAHDPTMPPWLRRLAEGLSHTEGDSDTILAPELRALVLDWLDHPNHARDWAQLFAVEAPPFLVTAARVLGLRQSLRSR